jgi:hypothetical protein
MMMFFFLSLHIHDVFTSSHFLHIENKELHESSHFLHIENKELQEYEEVVRTLSTSQGFHAGILKLLQLLGEEARQ